MGGPGGGLLGAVEGRDRALAVSVLAWIADDEAIRCLDALAAHDRSQWVREHAAWAAEVARGELSARSHYRKLLALTDATALTAGLEVLAPALPPIACWWHPKIEAEVQGKPTHGPAAAVRIAFWQKHEGRTSSQGPVVYGRGLRKFCRGEPFEGTSEPRIAPWFCPD